MQLLEDFGEYYDKNIKPYEDDYRKIWIENQKAKTKQRAFFIISIVLTIILLYITKLPFVIAIIMFSGVYFLAKTSTMQSAFMSKVKREIVSPAIRSCLNGFEYVQTGVGEYLFRESQLYRGYDYFYSSDMIRGKNENKSFTISEVKLEEENTDSEGHKSRVVVFNGVFIQIELEKAFETQIKIFPDIENKLAHTLVTGIGKMFNADKDIVKLENVEFERYFKVYSPNQIKARMILKPTFMEELVKLKDKYNKNMKFNFVDNKAYICIDKLKTIDDEKIARLGLSRGVIYSNLKVIEEIMTSIEFIGE